MTARLSIPNKTARQLWLQSHLLAQAPTGPLDVMGLIRGLGFVQLDTIQVVSRAHHHILWSRNNSYREHMFDPLLAQDRLVFEHFTHDASVLPMAYLPYWRRQFTRKRQQIEKSGWYTGMSGRKEQTKIKDRIRQEGALSTHAFDSKKVDPSVPWSRPPHKMALDYMWYAGELATCYRENFTKFYNLAERVFPADLVEQGINDAEQIDWLCRQALHRLGFATPREIKAFWDAMHLNETQDWIKQQSDLVPVRIQAVDRSWYDAWGAPDIEQRIASVKPATSRMRILNPFDPAIRDRDRLKRLFGMDYKIEIFVPAAKRKYGYYVYPVLAGDRMIARVETRADRAKSILTCDNLWPEDGITWGDKQAAQLHAELARLARFVGCTYVPA